MGSKWSEDGSTIAAPSRRSVEREVESAYSVIKEERGDKQTAIIGVVRTESLRSLEDKCRPSLWKIWTGSKSTILVTTDDWLQNTIETLRDSPRCRKLIIVVSAEVNTISFKVRSHFKSLKILSCGYGRDQTRKLLINGAATFGGVRVDSWQEEKRPNKLFLGKGVGIYVGLNWLSSKVSLTSELSVDKRKELKQHLESMREADMDGEWWRDWKGPIAAILGLTTTVGKFALGLKASAGGIYVNYQCGVMSLKAGAAGMKVSAVAGAAGPAVLVGAGVAAAVYFIPWDDVFTWLGSVFSRFLSWIMTLWNDFQSWLGRQAESSTRSFMPMSFSR